MSVSHRAVYGMCVDIDKFTFTEIKGEKEYKYGRKKYIKKLISSETFDSELDRVV